MSSPKTPISPKAVDAGKHAGGDHHKREDSSKAGAKYAEVKAMTSLDEVVQVTGDDIKAVLKNREKVEHRPKMWMVVSDSEDEEGEGTKAAAAEKHHSHHKHHKHHRRHSDAGEGAPSPKTPGTSSTAAVAVAAPAPSTAAAAAGDVPVAPPAPSANEPAAPSTSSKHVHKRRSRSSSSSSSSSSSTSDSSSDSSDSSSDSSGSGRKSRKHKKSDRKKSHKKHKSRSKSHKSKKDKKSKKSSKKSEKKPSGKVGKPVDQSVYGARGILREADFYTKQREFESWMKEVKSIADFNGPKWQLMELFKEYCEDYNTVSLPNDKYYDLERWEHIQMVKKMKKQAKKPRNEAKTDEELRRKELAEARESFRRETTNLIHSTMTEEKIEGMRIQQELQAKVQLLYKMGNRAEAEKLLAKLKPDE